ncbi:MAG: DEAD/DEAH box helicase, partial [Spirochaetaceae bacterium]|nr:DEAD/DEAH box helicase [Spirochaetaceae bacterium]
GANLRYSGKSTPDYRRFTGIARELLRAFLSQIKNNSRLFNIDTSDFSDGGQLKPARSYSSSKYIIRDPDEKLLGLALDAGLLKTNDNKTISRVEGVCFHALRLNDNDGISVNVSLVLLDEAGGTVLAGNITAVNSHYVLHEDKLYETAGLGINWKDTDIFFTRIKKTDIASYLSLIFSRFPDIELRYSENYNSANTAKHNAWQTRRIRPVNAQNALLFMEIDKYEYLHLRPISYLDGFPPEFLENEEIVTVVKMDETEKIFTIAEIVFPESSADVFRNFILKSKHGGGNLSGKAAFQKHIYEEAGRFIISPEFAKTFFSEMIFELSAIFVLLKTKVLVPYKVLFSKPKLKLSFSSGIDFLSGDAEIEFEDYKYSFTDFMNEYKNNACITLADGTRSFPDKRTMDKLERLVSTIKGGTVEVSFFDIPLLASDDAFEIDGKAWEKARVFFENYNSIEKRSGSWSLNNGTLRAYQEYGVRWLDYLMESNMGACLADEMGLGKTIQVISLLRNMAKNTGGLCLVLCPKSVVYNWAAEFDKFAPDLPYIVHYGMERDFKNISAEGSFKIILSTYATLRRDIEEFVKLEFQYVILDESQNIKNLGTQTTSAVLGLKTKHRIAMSGTPVENNLQDIYSLFRFLNPSFFGSQKDFYTKYLRPIQEDENEDALHDLKARLYPFILRRLKRDVLKELPAKTEETAYIELDKTQLSLYHRKRLEYKQLIGGIIKKGELAKSSILIFKALSELRRLASVPETEGDYEGPSAKRGYLIEQITNLAENGHKCLVFANFLAGVELVSQDLSSRGIANLTMTGATGNRQALVRSFQSDSEIKAFIMTLKTGGTGINLTAADYIFIMDPWWNSAAEAQAIDRSHRIGQTNPVFCYRLIARGTIEERILELQKKKLDLAGALLSDDAGAMKKLNEDDIAFLIGDCNE